MSLYYNELTGPALTRLILVNSGRVLAGFVGTGWLEMIYQWRPQDIVKMVIVFITLPDIRKGSKFRSLVI